MMFNTASKDEGKRGTLSCVPFCLVVILLGGIFLARPALCDLTSDLNRKGLKEMQTGRYREAIVYFESAYKTAPENETVRKNLGLAYYNWSNLLAGESDWAGAIRGADQALKYNPDNETYMHHLSTLYNNLGLSLADQEKFDLAEDNLKLALRYLPGSAIAQTNLYNILIQHANQQLRKKNERKSLRLAKEATTLQPEKPLAHVFVGEIYYLQDNFNKALENWEKALELNPQDETLQQKIEKLQREKPVEEKFRTKRREHFRIRFQKETGSDYAWVVSDILREARRKIGRQYNLFPEGVIPVIVYSKEEFDTATGAAHWTLGLYDGKIRLREQDISNKKDVLEKILYHEYSHALLFLSYGGNIPTWLHEGFAQYNEPDQALSKNDKEFIRSYIGEGRTFLLEDLDEMFKQKQDSRALRAAYLGSKLAIRYFFENHRRYSMKRLFEELKKNNDWITALLTVYHRSLERLNEEIGYYIEETG